MIEVNIPNDSIRQLQRFFADMPGRANHEVAMTINATLKKHRTAIKKETLKEIAISSKGAYEPLRISRRAKKTRPEGILTLRKRKRPSLKRFKARQIRVGVSYKLSKTEGRKRIEGAFGPNIAKLNNHVFKRAPGSRKLIKLHGLSVWGLYTQNKWEEWSEKMVAKEIPKQATRRIEKYIARQMKKRGL